MAIAYSGITVELREVFLSNKPPSMLRVSPKATVPILLLPDGRVIDESFDVMRWALDYRDPDSWWRAHWRDEATKLVEENDFQFKTHLDHYKYSERFPAQPKAYYREQGESFLSKLEQRLRQQPYLMGEELSFSDVAIFPFVRQFAFVDKSWFDRTPYEYLQQWLDWLLGSPLFLCTMTKYPAWKAGDRLVAFPTTA